MWIRRFIQALVTVALLAIISAADAQPDDPVEGLSQQALTLHQQGKTHEAYPIFKRVLEMREKQLGLEHQLVGVSLHNLAGICTSLQKFDEAERLFKRALPIYERVHGADAQQTAIVRANYGLMLMGRGDNVAAEETFRKAAGVFQRALGREHPRYGSALFNLAMAVDGQGRSREAVEFYVEATAVWVKAYGIKHPEVVKGLGGVASAYAHAGDLKKAAEYLELALGSAKALGPTHPAMIATSASLGGVYVEQGRLAEAKPLLLAALSGAEQQGGADTSAALSIRVNLGALLARSGDFNGAIAEFQRVVAARKRLLGPSHDSVLSVQVSTAVAQWEAGLAPRAAETLNEAFEAREKSISSLLHGGTEDERQAVVDANGRELDVAVSLSMLEAGLPARRLALTKLLRTKGRALDATAGMMTALRRSSNDLAPALLESMGHYRKAIARLALEGPSAKDSSAGVDTKEALDSLVSLSETAESKTMSILDSPGGTPAEGAATTIERVVRALPSDSVLVEIVAYTPIRLGAKSKGEQWSTPRRYAAFALQTGGEVATVDLGETSKIDADVRALRFVLSNPDSNPREAAQRLYAEVLAPLRGLIGAKRHVLIAADGSLNLVPFAALIDEKGQYAVSQYMFTYLTSGRDLVSVGSHGSSRSPPVVVANPDFGNAPGSASSPGSGFVLRHARFTPLPGTAGEGELIAKILPGAKLLSGRAATVAELRSLHAPRVLHIATHGFFLDPTARATGNGRGLELVGSAPAQRHQTTDMHLAASPLLRSGLALADANVHGDESGFLSAYEAATLDLLGTQLVVLSACETGVGTTVDGEGVYGLRRAFVLAGAETIVMSMWKVDDEATRDLMSSYHQKLATREGRSVGLRSVQLAMLADPRRRHPYFWASFISSGDWRPLDSGALEGASPGVPPVERRAGGCACHAVPERDGSGASIAGLVLVMAAGLRRSRRRADEG